MGMKLIIKPRVWQRVWHWAGTNKYILKTKPQNLKAAQDPIEFLEHPVHLKAGEPKLF